MRVGVEVKVGVRVRVRVGVGDRGRVLVVHHTLDESHPVRQNPVTLALDQDLASGLRVGVRVRG